MLLRFQKRPLDLHIVLGYTAFIGAWLLTTSQSLLAAIPFIIFVPGYFLVAALIPEEGGLRWTARITLSLGLSLSVVSAFGLLLHFAPSGISFQPVVLIILFFTGVMATVAYARRLRLPPERRLSATFAIRGPPWAEYSRGEKAWATILAISLGTAGSVLVYVVTTPQPAEPFTGFFILGPEGQAGGYPTSLNYSEEGVIIFTVVNHEFALVDYTLRVDRVGVVLVHNETSGLNETVEVTPPTPMAWLNRTLDHDTTWREPFAFSIDAGGMWKVRLLLFRDGDFGTVYRNLFLVVTVNEG